MAFGNYTVSAFIHFGTDYARTYAQIATGNSRLLIQQARLRGQLSQSEAAWLANSAAIERNSLAMRRAQGMVAGGLALAGAVGIGYGIDQAAQWQKAITSVGIAMDQVTAKHMMSQQQLAPFYAMAVRMSNVTAQSVTTMAQELGVAATSGLANKAQLLAAFPRIAQAADVLWMAGASMGKPVNPVTAVKQLTQLTHLFGQYSGPGFYHMIDRAVQMMFSQPESLQALVTQGRYFIPYSRTAGVSEEDIFRSAMTMGQTAQLRARGGAGLRRVIQYLSGAAVMTGHLSTAQHAAMMTLGLTGSNGRLLSEFIRQRTDSSGPKGGLLLQRVVDHLETISHNMTGPQFVQALNNAFLAQGGTYLATALSPGIYRQSGLNWAHMQRMATMEQMWKEYTNTFSYAWSDFWTNLSNVFGATFKPLLPAFTQGLKDAAKWLASLTDWLMSHPKAAAAIAIGAFTAVGVAGVFAMSRIWALDAAINALAASAARTSATIYYTGTAANAAATGSLARFATLLRGLAVPAGILALFIAFAKLESAGMRSATGTGNATGYSAWLRSHWGSELGKTTPETLIDYGNYIRSPEYLTRYMMNPSLTKNLRPVQQHNEIRVQPGSFELHVHASIIDETTIREIKGVMGAYWDSLMSNARTHLAKNGSTIRTHPEVPFALTASPL